MHKGSAMASPRAFAFGRAAARLAGFATSIAIAARGFVRWVGPFGMVIAAILLLMVAAAMDDKPNVLLGVLGSLMLFSAVTAFEDSAKTKETERWAKLIADMIAKDATTTFEVKHSFASIRPELDELVERLVAQAMSAGTAETVQAVEGDSPPARPKGCAQKGSV